MNTVTTTAVATTNDTANIVTEAKATNPDADAINREHERARRHVNDAIKHAILCGELLLARKAELPHGIFKHFVVRECRIPYSTAARYMKAAKLKVSGVDISALSRVFASRSEAERRQDRVRSFGRSMRRQEQRPPSHPAKPVVAAITTDHADDHHHVVVSPDDRATMLAAIKVAITTFADRYGWGAAAMDVGAWIESQAETDSAT